MKSKIYGFISLALLSTIVIAGCQSTPPVDNTAIPVKSTAAATMADAMTAAPTETLTVAPSKTSTIHPTITASATDIVESTEEITGESNPSQVQETATSTPMKIADWSSAEFFTSGSLAHWQYFIALQFDGQITGNYYAIVDKNKDYDCEILPMYPNRLYCDGPQAAFMDYVKFQVFNADTDEIVYDERLWIPGSYYSGE